jgi:hypothetical protein
MVGLLLAVAVEVSDARREEAVPPEKAEVIDARREEARKAVEALAHSVPAAVDVESGGDAGAPGEVGATLEFEWAPAVPAPAPVVETPAVAVEAPAPGFHSEVEVFRVAASARRRGEAQRLLDATVAKLVAKGVDRSRIETDVSVGPRKVRIQIVKVKNVVRDPEGSTR